MIQTNIKFPWLLFLITLLLLGADLYLSLTNPVTAVSKELGLGQDFIRFALSISFTGSLFASFFFGAWSYILLSKKTESRLLAKSILTLTLVLLIGVMLSVIRSHFFYGDTYGMYRILTIIINHVYSLGYLIGFGLLLYSTKILLPMVRDWNMSVSVLIALLIGTFYAVILLTSPDKILTSTPDFKPSYFLPDSWIIFTIILPTILGWFLAVWSAFRLSDIYNLSTTTTTTSPSYRDGIRNILYGILFIVFSTIMLQAILSIGTTRFIAGGLVLILVVLYLFVAFLVIGNFLVLKGARKLIQAA